MLMTEEDAAAKWCPHVRLPAQFQAHTGNVSQLALAAAAVNLAPHPMKPDEMTRNGTQTTCIGSRCSQWRWHYTYAALRGDPSTAQPITSRKHGYCGLAGMPAGGTEV